MQRAIDWIGMGAAVLLGALVTRSLLTFGFGPTDLAIITISIPAGLLAADFVSGVAHWLADRVLSEDMPVFGPYFVLPFRDHHREPESILLHGWVETVGNTCISVAPLLVVALVAMESMSPGSARTAAGALMLSLAVWLCLTNQFHKWAHSKSPSRPVRMLQRSGLILSARHHARHHVAPYDTRYCITTGWFNPTLDRIRFFPSAERALRAARLPPAMPAVSGDEPTRGTPEHSA